MKGLVVYCADIGSVRGKRFGWARVDPARAVERECGKKINDLASAVAQDLTRGPVSLGFECPLWVPVPAGDESSELGRARANEGSHAWSAGAGAAVTATSLVQIPWILQAVRAQAPGLSAYLNWSKFREAGAGLHLWEVFVSGEGKSGLGLDLAADLDKDVKDSVIGAELFVDLLPDPTVANAVEPAGAVHSLIGAALIRSGWSDDATLLAKPCLVLKAGPE